jgi:hypothetical protein
LRTPPGHIGKAKAAEQFDGLFSAAMGFRPLPKGHPGADAGNRHGEIFRSR